jgi:hypothetical protein
LVSGTPGRASGRSRRIASEAGPADLASLPTKEVDEQVNHGNHEQTAGQSEEVVPLPLPEEGEYGEDDQADRADDLDHGARSAVENPDSGSHLVKEAGVDATRSAAEGVGHVGDEDEDESQGCEGQHGEVRRAEHG